MSGAIQPMQRKVAATGPPLPPFTRESAMKKIRLIEYAWNSRGPEKMVLAYTIVGDSL